MSEKSEPITSLGFRGWIYDFSFTFLTTSMTIARTPVAFSQHLILVTRYIQIKCNGAHGVSRIDRNDCWCVVMTRLLKLVEL